MCQQLPLCWKCHLSRIKQRDERMGVNIISSEGARDGTSLTIPFQDAFWSSSCNMWIMNLRMKVRVDLFRRLLVNVMGLRLDLIDNSYTLFPPGAKLPDIVRIPYTNGVTLVGYFRWDEVHEEDIPLLRKCFRKNVNILAHPRHARTNLPNFMIELKQVVLSPTFFENVQQDENCKL